MFFKLLCVYIIVIAFVLTPFAVLLQWTTRWIAGFEPRFRQAFWAMFFWLAFAAAANFFLGLFGEALQSSTPRTKILGQLIPVLFGCIVFGIALKDPSGVRLGFGRGVGVSLIFGTIVGLFFIFFGDAIGTIDPRFKPAVLPQSQATPTLAAQPTPSPAPKATPAPFFPVRRFASADEAKQEAVRLYPNLGVAGSEFNRAFLAKFNQYQKERPSYFNDKSWPLRLAAEISGSDGK